MPKPTKSVVDLREYRRSKSPYAASFLTDALPSAVAEMTDADFAAFQVAETSKFRPDFSADAFSVILCDLDSNNMIANAPHAVFFNMRENELDAYRQVQHLDIIRPVVLRNTGTGIFNTDFFSLEQWRGQEMFEAYYRTLDVLHSVSIAFEVPFHERRRLQFTYFKRTGQQFGATLTKDEVEYLSIPFYYAWASRWGLIDDVTLKRWCGLLTSRTGIQLFLLRDLVARERYALSLTAQKFEIPTRIANHHFVQIYEGVVDRLRCPNRLEGNASKMVDLAQAFHFLRFIGDYRPRR